jgi:hypothetical protein
MLTQILRNQIDGRNTRIHTPTIFNILTISHGALIILLADGAMTFKQYKDSLTVEQHKRPRKNMINLER